MTDDTQDEGRPEPQREPDGFAELLAEAPERFMVVTFGARTDGQREDGVELPLSFSGRGRAASHSMRDRPMETAIRWTGDPNVTRGRLAMGEPATEVVRAVSRAAGSLRPRVRAWNADPDDDPLLVIDRWTAPVSDLPTMDLSALGLQGVIVFPMDVDLDDDGMEGDVIPAEVVKALEALEHAARTVVTVARDNPPGEPVAGHLAALGAALTRVAEAREAER